MMSEDDFYNRQDDGRASRRAGSARPTSQRPSARSRTTAQGTPRQRSSSTRGTDYRTSEGGRVQRPAERTGRTRQQVRGQDSASQARARARQRIDGQTRISPDDRVRTRTAARDRTRADASASPASGVLSAVLGVLSAIGSAIVGFFEWLRDRVPPLQRFSAPVLSVAAGVLVVCVVGFGFAFGGRGAAPQDAADTAADQEQQEQSSQAAASSVNPDEPADLVWRDTEFAVSTAPYKWSTNDNGRKVVYLTVDDGPSQLTESYLDLFDKYGVKATFFVTGHDPNYYHLIREAYNRGHTIGLHTMTHEYDQVYASEAAYFADLDAVGQVVAEQIGYVPCFIRFPGGSSNGIASEYSSGLMPKLIKGVLERGYQYYDWSLSSGDGEVHTAEELIAQSTQPNGAGVGADPTKDTNIILLCHDSPSKQSTYEALPKIIESYQKRGYSFEAIDRTTWVCHHVVEGVSTTTDSSSGVNAATAGQDDTAQAQTAQAAQDGATADSQDWQASQDGTADGSQDWQSSPDEAAESQDWQTGQEA